VTHRTMALAVLVGCLLAATFAVWAQETSRPTSRPATRPAAKPPRDLINPTSGTPQSATPRAVCTFQSIGLYWTPEGGAEDKACRVQYRVAGEPAWREALPLWFDKRIGEYRGSIVQLKSGTAYDVRLSLPDGKPADLKAATWNENFPIAKTVQVDDLKGKTLTIDQSGTPGGYVLYAPRKGAATAVIDCAKSKEDSTVKAGEKVLSQGAYELTGAQDGDNGVVVKASYVILRGLTIKAPKVHGIVLDRGCHDVVIEGCDISGWGRIHTDGFGVDMDSAVFSNYTPLTRVVVQRCRMHDPRSNSNSWQQFREIYHENKHPDGPQGISFIESAGNHVFRYNDFMTDDDHYCNDIFGGGANNSLRGFPGGDSDVYGNHIEGCWDDGLEIEGGGCNVRIWGNYINRTMVKIAIAGLSVGPIYIFRNVAGSGQLGPGSPGGGAFVKMGSAARLARPGGVYIFHNTILQPLGPGGRLTGCDEGWGGAPLSVSRNNILHVRGSSSIRSLDKKPYPEFDYDYDLLSARGASTGAQEQHSVTGVPIYAKNRPEGDFSLDPRSPGYQAGVAIPNFSDGFRGKAPDMGAFEHGSTPMEFGVKAYLGTASSQPTTRP